MCVLKVEGLCKSFGGLMAVDNLTFEVKEGEIVGLIGPNGSGKTTCLNLITGFLKPDSGTVTFRGENITGLPRCRACQNGIARTFQLIKPFLDFTALQNVMVGRVYGREPTKNLKVAAEESREFLERVGLLDKSDWLNKSLLEPLIFLGRARTVLMTSGGSIWSMLTMLSSCGTDEKN
jgi:ABC-type branched-subunit amino acid transport system ATPase component